MKPPSQPVPPQVSSTSGQSGGILERARNATTDLIENGVEIARKGVNVISQTVDNTTQVLKDGVSTTVQTAGKVAGSASDMVSGMFDNKPPQTQTSEQTRPQNPKPQPPEIKPIQTTTQNQRSQEGGTPKVVVEKQGNCSCNRDLTLSEFNHILNSLGVKGTSLFTAENCELNQKERNAETLLKFLNQIFKKYQINTCLRRIHFLAQIYHESSEFQTTTEYVSGEKYNSGRHNDATANGNT